MVALLLVVVNPVAAKVCVVDDSSNTICLEKPAGRIVTLSPAATELEYAVGAGKKIVGTVDFSDYPASAQAIPRIGDSGRIDMEALLALRPDLVVAWGSGTSLIQVQRLKNLGMAVYLSNPDRLAEIATSLQRLAVLSGTRPQGQEAADSFSEQLDRLGKRYAQEDPVTVFYEVWDKPLMTINHEQLINKVISLCGGENVFAHLHALTPRIGEEAVLNADPDVIVVGGQSEHAAGNSLEAWKRFGSLKAVRRNNLFFIPSSLLVRPTPRLLEGARKLCHDLNKARHKDNLR